MAMNLQDGFLADLERTENALSELELCMGAGRTDIEKTTQYLYRRYHRASLTGNPAEFAATRRSIDAALDRYGRWPDIWLLKANLDFKFHRLDAVEEMLAALPGLAASPSGKVLQADLAFQLGNYEEARQGYERAIETDRTWDTQARPPSLT